MTKEKGETLSNKLSLELKFGEHKYHFMFYVLTVGDYKSERKKYIFFNISSGASSIG